MDWKSLFLSFDGRISRMQFWIGVIIYIVVVYALTFGLGALLGIGMIPGTTASGGMAPISPQAGWMSLFIFVVSVWPGAALSIKRRHDRGNPGYDVWAAYGLQFLNIVLQVLGLAGGTIWTVVAALMVLISLYLLVVLGFLKGDDGTNAFGADPRVKP